MKVFISWSGSSSQAVAELLADTLPVIIQSVKPFISVEDLRKGGRWQSELSDALESTGIGIICMTRSNLEAPWIMFEAGALSKSVSEARVMPLLLGLSPADIRPPLSQFNLTKVEHDDFLRLVKSINELLGDASLPERVLSKSFEQAWPSLEAAFTRISAQEDAINREEGTVPGNPLDLIRVSIDEILTLVRSQAGSLHAASEAAVHEHRTRLVRAHADGEAAPPLAISGKTILVLEARRRKILTALVQLESVASQMGNAEESGRIIHLTRELKKALLPVFQDLLGSPEADLIAASHRRLNDWLNE